MNSISNEKFYNELKCLIQIHRPIDKNKLFEETFVKITVMISLSIDGFVSRPPFEQKFRGKKKHSHFDRFIFCGSVKWYINSKAWNKADQIRILKQSNVVHHDRIYRHGDPQIQRQVEKNEKKRTRRVR